MKRGFNIAANITAIVLVSILALADIVLMAASEYYETVLVTLVTALVLTFCIGTIIVSSITLALGNRKGSFGLKITVTVLIAAICILEFVGGGYVYGALCIVPVALEITSICLPPDKPAPTPAQTPIQMPMQAPIQPTYVNAPVRKQTIEEKIAELKRLKELGVLTDEEYTNAITKIINDAK